MRLGAFIVDTIIVYAVSAILTALVALPAHFTGGVGSFGFVFRGLAVSKGYQKKYSDHLMGTKVIHS